MKSKKRFPISQLAAAPFDQEAFRYAFLEAFGNKATTIKRLKSTGKGSTNQSDLPGGALQRNKAKGREMFNHFMARLIFCFLPKIPIFSTVRGCLRRLLLR
nr:hypothetical protein [Arthrospira sp. SH-MAG29]